MQTTPDRMQAAAIEVSDLTKDYGQNRGVFNISLAVQAGECFGFLGPNGAGKTTTIRHIMGFSKPQQGFTAVLGRDSWRYQAQLQNQIGYLPGEITLPLGLSGTKFLAMVRQLHKCADATYCQTLAEMFELKTNRDIKQMSLGDKRKLAIVAAFVHDPQILILDEPTSGLDPVMQQVFIDFVLKEKRRGKTVFFSSHIFREIESCCSRVAIIKEGQIVSEFAAAELKTRSDHVYRIGFGSEAAYLDFAARDYHFTQRIPQAALVTVLINDRQINQLVMDLAASNITEFYEIPFTLEDYFMQFYKDEHDYQEIR